MKEIYKIAEKENINNYVYNLWRSDDFKEAQDDPESVVSHWVREFCKVPRVFFEMSDEIETAHFSTYWNFIPLRTVTIDGNLWYDNPVIHDLYIMHEIVHAVLLDQGTFDENMPFYQWYDKMVYNEFLASIETEVIVYFDMPSLRKKAFSHRIWADRFLVQEEYLQLWYTDQRACRDKLEEARKQAMTSPSPFDWLELQLASYVKSNVEYATIWKDDFRTVERIMRKFHKNLSVYGTVAIDDLVEDMKTPEGIPFIEIAKHFHSVYTNTKKEYGNKILEMPT